MKVKKKPVEVQAWRVRDLIETAHTEWDSLPDEIQEAYGEQKIMLMANCIDIETTDNVWHRAKIDDYVICGVNGELYPIPADIFEKTYEVIE